MEKIADTFNLSALVHEVLATSEAPDPPALTKEVLHQIDETDRDAALEQALLVFVRNAVSRDRYRPPSPDNTGPLPADGRAPGVGDPSRKASGVYHAWVAARLRERIAVSSQPHDYKFLGDCTRDNLLYAAEAQENYARRNLIRAQQKRNLADLMDQHGVSLVRQLPEDVLVTALGIVT